MAGEKNENGVLNFVPYTKPPDRTAWENFKITLYNKEDRTIIGRTPFQWGQLCVFYVCFYTVLAAMFSICMYGLFSTLNDKEPKWQLDSSLIGTNPGMGFRPIPEADEGSLIQINSTNPSTALKYINLMDVFLRDYTSGPGINNRVPCDFDKLPGQGQVCLVDIDEFGDCNRNNSYGYLSGSPCVFLKLNRIFGWQPEFYNKVEDLPANMPETLKDHIATLASSDSKQLDQIWVSCKGEKPADEENIHNGNEESFQFFPKRGIPGYYFPFRNVENYLSPLVAVKVVNIKPNVLVNIECRAWAKNIKYSGLHRDRQGSVHFEIMIDQD